MPYVVMRHGRRGTAVDASLTQFAMTSLETSAPEVQASVRALVAAGTCLSSIVTSPYLRTRQTALVAQHHYQRLTGRCLPIRVDVRLGEFLPPLQRPQGRLRQTRRSGTTAASRRWDASHPATCYGGSPSSPPSSLPTRWW